MQVKALVEFLSGLEKNNQRSWFVWNKPAYDLLRAEFEELVADLAARVARFRRSYDGFDDEDALARPPKGFPADTPHIETIKLRHFFGIIEVDLKKHPPTDLAAEIAAYFHDVLPLMEWLRQAVAWNRS